MVWNTGRGYNKRTRPDDLIAYCPKCGRLDTIIYNFRKIGETCEHCKSPGFFKDKPTPLIVTEETLGQDFFNDDLIPADAGGFTIEMYQYMWDKYVCTPENDKLDEEEFNSFKKYITGYLANGGWDGNKLPPTYTCPKCGYKSLSENKQKQGFGVGKAVVGVAVAGPIGAAAGAIGMNKEKRVCPNFGHKW